MSAPIVFVSYSHDSEPHVEWVVRLASDLRRKGVDAKIDQWDLALGQDVAAFMTRSITEAERVLLICSDKYVLKAEQGTGGVAFELSVVTNQLVQSIDTRKFLPLIRGNGSDQKIPAFLGPRRWLDFEDDQAYEERLDELLRDLHGEPPTGRPPLGANPFSGSTPLTSAPSRSAGPTGRTSAGAILEEDWFGAQAGMANDGISAVGLDGRMEVRAALHDSIAASQIELLSAVRSSQIQTFGWPIAALVEGGVDEYRPRPVEDGIRAEIPIDNDTFSDRTSYDFWAARTNGDFFLLQSLFEDQRSEQKIFFNTRIVRVAEALMFFRSFYDSLGVPGEALLSVALTHGGLAGRELTASTPNRQILPGARAVEPRVRTEHTLVLGSVDEDLGGSVQRLLAPMFMLFDFREFGEGIYRDIADRFRHGEVT